ncbi:MAG: class I SAM-dependent methyltransferase [Prochlorothrix sp.]|nr:class I SAM-dependent methyltransferase [Prochlorothrix sp.]
MRTQILDTKTEQDYGDNPIAVRKTDHYKQEYVEGFVDKWDALIDWEKRAESEGRFFIDMLRERGVKKVLDVATGTGFHSIRLLEAGFDVVSCDGSANMLAKAFENARKHGHLMRTVQADWRFLNRDIHGHYDAVICLGNSFTHLFAEKDRRKALAEFYAALRHDGLLVLDQRNYDSILDNGFSSKHAYYYCGKNVTAEPEYVDEGLARFKYQFPDGSSYNLNMYPLRKSYTQRLMHEVGFQKIDTYGDFQDSYQEDDPDFFVHVAEKLYKE